MKAVELPDELVKEIGQACKEQNLDLDEILRSVRELVSTETCLDYSVWGGPGWREETLRLDIFVLGQECLFNYANYKDHTDKSCIFLDTIQTVSLMKLSVERTPYILLVHHGERIASLNGRINDRDRIERFRRNLVKARLLAKKSRRRV